jgi:hypothetical protein
MAIYGIDASDYDWSRGPVDVAAMVSDGISFLSHKATEATITRHVHLADALNRGRAAGLRVLGAYHVVRSSPSVSAQVSYFFAYLDSAVPWWRAWPGFILQVDLEKWQYDPVTTPEAPDRFRTAARAAMTEGQLLRAAGTGASFAAELRARKPPSAYVIVYASKGQYGDSLTGIGSPLWNANYPSSRFAPYRSLYPGDGGVGWATYSGQTPLLWQYASSATIGSQPGCDINAYRGSLSQLLTTLTAGTAPVLQADLDQIARAVWTMNLGPAGKTQATGNMLLDAASQINDGVSPYDARIGWLAAQTVALHAKLDVDAARDAGMVAALDSARTAITGLASVIQAGGGDVEVAALLARMDDIAAAESDTVAALVAQVAELQSDLHTVRAALARASQATAAELAPGTGD